jgi:hypothetical protein
MQLILKRFGGLALVLLIHAAMAEEQLQSADLHEGWAILSEASTDVYFRDRFYSDVTNFSAITKLPELAKNGRARQKTCAEALIEVVGKKTISDLALTESRTKLKSDEKIAQMKIFAGGMLATAEQAGKNAGQMLDGKRTASSPAAADDGFDALFLGVMGDLGGSASAVAEADFAAANARLKLRAAWEAKVFPAIRNLQSIEAKTTLVVGELTVGESREVWSVFRNDTDKTLTNVTIIFRSKDKLNNGESDLPAQIYFIRHWPKDVVIRPSSFRRKVISNGAPDFEPPTGPRGTLEVWSDQGHTAPANVKRIGYYKYRDQFLETMVHEGAQYSSGGDSDKTVLQFTKVTNEKNNHTIEAKLMRLAKEKNDPAEELLLKGTWSNYENLKAEGDNKAKRANTVEPTVRLIPLNTPVVAPPAVAAPGKKNRRVEKPTPVVPAFVFQLQFPLIQWTSPEGTKLALQAVPEAKSTK